MKDLKANSPEKYKPLKLTDLISQGQKANAKVMGWCYDLEKDSCSLYIKIKGNFVSVQQDKPYKRFKEKEDVTVHYDKNKKIYIEKQNK